jgi:hypothetical protein
MSVRFDISTRVVVGGKQQTLFIVQNPTIDDVLAIEMRLYAADVEAGAALNPGYRVARDVRDSLIKAGG